jgi:hypothetical protein
MNKSKVFPVTVIPPPTPPPPVYSLTLEMSKEDAVALRTVCGLIGGGRETSPRHLFDKISLALGIEGIKVDNSVLEGGEKHVGIYFRDYKQQ